MIAATIFTSCKKDFLDKKPIGVFSDDDVWTDPALAQTFLSNVYSLVPSGFERGDLDWHHSIETFDDFSDDAVSQYPWTPYQFVVNGSVSPTNSPLNASWLKNYPAIRSANTFLQNIGNVPGDEALKQRMRGEAQFLRAVFYEELVKVFGGVPIITSPQSLTDELLVERSSYEECIAFLVQQLDSASSVLPNTYSDAEYGRATKGAAMALKARVLLYAGRWAEAAAEAKKVMDLNIYELSPNYQQLFIKGDPKEMIYAKRYNELQTYNGVDYNDFNDKNQPYFAGGWGSMNPTQNLVDDYEMSDGLLTEESPLYNPFQPFLNREERFYASIIYQGATWKGKTIDFTNNTEYSATGYYLKKYLNENQVLYNKGATLDWPLLRYAEVLLNFAEATNEATGPDQSVYDAVNMIRARGGQPDLPLGLTQAQLRERIRRERRIELAFEEHRYWDVLRWGLGSQLLNAPIYGIKKQPDGTFSKFKVVDRVFVDPKSRNFPIPQSEIDKNEKLTQNPGW